MSRRIASYWLLQFFACLGVRGSDKERSLRTRTSTPCHGPDPHASNAGRPKGLFWCWDGTDEGKDEKKLSHWFGRRESGEVTPPQYKILEQAWAEREGESYLSSAHFCFLLLSCLSYFSPHSRRKNRETIWIWGTIIPESLLTFAKVPTVLYSTTWAMWKEVFECYHSGQPFQISRFSPDHHLSISCFQIEECCKSWVHVTPAGWSS